MVFRYNALGVASKMARYLFPKIPSDYSSYVRTTYSVFIGKHLMRIYEGLVFVSNFQNLFFRKLLKFPIWEIVPSGLERVSLSILSVSVLRIIFRCSEKQMIWANTVSNVAFMTNQETFWYRSNKKFIRKSMHPDIFIINMNSPISMIFPHRANPQPTRVCFLDFRKKSFSQILFWWSHITHRIMYMTGDVNGT